MQSYKQISDWDTPLAMAELYPVTHMPATVSITKQVSASYNACNLYSGGGQSESLPEYKIFLLRFFTLSLQLPMSCQQD
jgi:hypothetical protein